MMNDHGRVEEGALTVAGHICLSWPGRSGGWRVLAAFRPKHRCVFLYAFAKNERDNIDDDELAHWHKVANAYLVMSAARIENQIENDELRQVMCDE